MYKKLTEDDNLFLFLDPDPIGDPDRHSFVFSRDKSRWCFGESRIVVASVNPSWRPWQVEHERVYVVNATSSDTWTPIMVGSKPACAFLEVGFLDEQLLGKSCIPRCSEALTFLDVLVQFTVAIQTYPDYSWTLELPRSLPSYTSWIPTDLKRSSECTSAPPYPKLIWSVDGKGVAIAHQDREAAAVFERATKTSLPIFHVKSLNGVKYADSSCS